MPTAEPITEDPADTEPASEPTDEPDGIGRQDDDQADASDPHAQVQLVA
ncbi:MULTISPECIES: hypothetical protein [unclassified Streptomyces]